jgi:hypothetical protein
MRRSDALSSAQTAGASPPLLPAGPEWLDQLNITSTGTDASNGQHMIDQWVPIVVGNGFASAPQ